MSEQEMRTCRTCQLTLPLETAFYRTGDRKNGRTYHHHQCKRCYRAYNTALRLRTRPPAYRRMPRYNARGDAYCPSCKAYLPVARFRPHPANPTRLWAYCVECTRAKDKQRKGELYLDADAWARELERRTESKRRQRVREQADRREFVMKALDTLRHKGLAWADIAELTGISGPSLWAWRHHPKRRITAAAEARIAALLTAALDLPVQERIVRNRRAPAGVMALLRERTAPRIATLKPTRSRWRSRQEAA